MIPTNPPPTFTTPELWSDSFRDFVSKCLVKNPENRATATQLLQVRGSIQRHQVERKLDKKLNCFFFAMSSDVSVPKQCFHDTFAILLYMHMCEKQPDESFKNLPAMFERFFQVQMFPSPVFIVAILRFCSVPVVMETLPQTEALECLLQQ